MSKAIGPLNLAEWLTGLLGGGLAGWSLFGAVQVLYSLDVAGYEAVVLPVSAWNWMVAAGMVAAGAGLVLFWLYRLREAGVAAPAQTVWLAGWPLPLSAAAVFGMPGLWGALVFTLAAGWSVFRAMLLVSKPERWLRQRKSVSLIIGFSWLFGAYLVWTGFMRQQQALAVLHLYFHDWGLFLDVARNTLRGEWFVTSETGLNFLGNHFMPLTIVLLMPFAAFCDSPEPFFWFNALLLYSNSPLIYWLARLRKLPRGMAAVLALAVLCAPSLSNLVLAQRYGFHENYFFMPLLIFYFICREKGWAKRAWLVWGMSLLLKETIAVVWFGVGVVEFLRGERRRGMVLALLSTGWFFLMVKWVMPYCQGGEDYQMLFVFSNLGNSVGEVMLSPFTRPGVFWGTLFSWNNAAFLLLILLPVFFATLSRPLWLVAGVLPWVFVAVQEGAWMRNICSQHHADFLMLVYINAVLALAALRHEREAGFWGRMLGKGLPKRSGRATAAALTTATVVTAGLSFYFFAQGIHGKYSFNAVSMQRDFSAEMEGFKVRIPPGTELNASFAPAAHFALRNRVYPNTFHFYYLSDRVLLDLFSEFEDLRLFDQVRGHLLTHGYRVTRRVRADDRLLVLLEKGGGMSEPDGLSWMADAEFRRFGAELPQSQKAFSVRIAVAPDRIRFLIRLEEAVRCDYRIHFLVADVAGNVSGGMELFGKGVTPAFLVPAGTVLALDFPLPADFGAVREVRFRLDPRPEVNFSDAKFPITGMNQKL